MKPPRNILNRDVAREVIDGTWYRVSSSDFRDDPIYFSTNRGVRFSSPEAKYGVCYLGSTPEAAYAETVRDAMLSTNPDTQHKYIPESSLRKLELHRYKIQSRNGIAISLYDEGLIKIDARLEYFCTGDLEGYQRSQSWARSLMEHPCEATGLIYLGNRSGAKCLALFGAPNKSGFKHAIKGVSTIGRSYKPSPLLKRKDFFQWLQDAQIEMIPVC